MTFVRLHKRQIACALAAGILVAAPSPAKADLGSDIREIFSWIFGTSGSWFGDGQTPPAPPPPPAEPQSRSSLFPDTPVVGFSESSLNAKVKEGEGVVALEISRDKSAGERIALKYRTVPGSAEEGKDFAAASGLVEFSETDLVKRLKIRILDDTAFEADEQFSVELSDVSGASLDPGRLRATVTIVNDDQKPRELSPANLVVVGGSKVSFGAILVGDPAMRKITWRNTGEKAAVVNDLRLEGDKAFSIRDEECRGKAVAPGGTCFVEVAFKPAGDGVYSGSLIAVTKGTAGKAVLAGSARLPKLAEDPMARRIAALRAERRATEGKRISYRLDPLSPAEAPRYKQTHEDWTTVDIQKNFFTYPVDQARVITVHKSINCLLNTNIFSQIPGFVHCTVEKDVFGTSPDKRLVLLPKGTRVFGDYQGTDSPGDTRLNVVWRRFTTPDGRGINIENGFQAQDVTGGTGVPGVLHSRFWERYGVGLLFATAPVGVALATPQDDERYAAAFEAGVENTGQVTQQILERNLDIKEILIAARGTRLLIQPLADLWFPEPSLITGEDGGAVAVARAPQK
jgi:hypothetical protein